MTKPNAYTYNNGRIHCVSCTNLDHKHGNLRRLAHAPTYDANGLPTLLDFLGEPIAPLNVGGPVPCAVCSRTIPSETLEP